MKGLPELFNLRLKARSLAYLFTAGAGLGALSLLLPHDEAVRDLQIWIVVGCALAIGLVLYWTADRVREWHLQLALAAGTTLITFANYYTGTVNLYALLYTWAGLYAFYFLGTRAGLAHLAYIGVAYAIVLAQRQPPSP
ncbi:MAG: hypothetical protein QOI45_1027, partial [Thermoleophilaceae bacterium]|nr:hypothetical protein [Thermoleophilaceae bacterium]